MLPFASPFSLLSQSRRASKCVLAIWRLCSREMGGGFAYEDELGPETGACCCGGPGCELGVATRCWPMSWRLGWLDWVLLRVLFEVDLG